MLHLLDATMFWTPTGGGVRRYLCARREWIAAGSGWRETLLVPGGCGDDAEDAGGIAIPASAGYRFPLSRRRNAEAMRALAPDVIEVADPYRLAWSAIDARRQGGMPIVAFCHSDLGAVAARAVAALPAAARLTEGAARAADRYLAHVYRRFDLVLAASAFMQRRLEALGLANVERQSLGVDTRVFTPERRDTAFRERLGIAAGARMLVYAGRLAPEKNLRQLSDAVRLLGEGHWLVAIGDGPSPPRGERVRVLPHRHDPAALASALASADLFVHAGDQETFGLAPLEAMACGTPIVVRDAAGLSELAASGAGAAVDSADADVWARAIASALAAPRAPRSDAARAVAERHDWRVLFPAQMRRYERLIDEASRGIRPSAAARAGEPAASNTNRVAMPRTTGRASPLVAAAPRPEITVPSRECVPAPSRREAQATSTAAIGVAAGISVSTAAHRLPGPAR